MYVPPFNAVDDEHELRAMVAAVGAAEFITTGRDGYPWATLLPIVWTDDVVIAHFARANAHWRQIEGDVPALLVCGGAQTYVSPSWYASKGEHGRVVPTWNYTSVHLTGRARIHDDVAWLRRAVTELTEHHEESREPSWRVTDAPDAFIAGQLRGIVGVEMRVERVEGKKKLSQNRSEDDRLGVIDGLRSDGGSAAQAVADAMARME